MLLQVFHFDLPSLGRIEKPDGNGPGIKVPWIKECSQLARCFLLANKKVNNKLFYLMVHPMVNTIVF
jgi:hypothetical protein